ncbi:ASI1-immunoprecipitated protein 2 [Musa acuminata AAA Group]|uniref:ASI1-immunoprecipitated protein 2 n=1 Tax=Musa acuminata AAA Group TaxID=214697 RepID=UPI0031E33E04
MDMTISDVKGGPYGNMLSRKEDRSSCIAASGPAIKRRACYTQKNLSSETGHFLCYGSIHDSSLKNDKSKEMSKASVAYDASKNVVISPKVILDEVTYNKLVREETSLTARSPFSSHGIKTSDLCQRKASDIAKEKHREECHTKNDLHISGFKEANSAVHVCLGQLHKKLKECSSGLTDSSRARNDIEEIQNEAAYDCNNSELQENQTEFKENGEFSLENRTIHSIIDDVSCHKTDSTEHPPSSSNVSPMSQSPCSGSPMNGILSRCSINDEKSPILGKYVVGEKDDMPDEVSKEDSRKSRSQLVSSKGSDECMGTEIDDNRKFQPRDTIKGRATNEQADKQFNQVPSQPNSECEASAEIEADVKVCDICGDSGLEELLAFCSRCSDGAEHTYCMQVRLDTVPESEWVCEECRLKEAQNQMIGQFESQLEAIEAVCSSENSQSLESTSKNLSGVENKAVDLGTTKDNKELDKLILSKRTEEKFDVTKEKISEACGASTGTTVSRKPTLVVCDNTINKSDLVKVKLPALITSCCQSEGISRPGANAQSSSYSNSFKLQTHFELTKGSLSKSVSFNKSKVPKVKQLLENIPHKQKMTREYSLSSMRKGGPSQAITKSASFRSESSGFSNVSTVGDMQLPNPPPCEDLRYVKQVKEKSMTDKRLFMSDRPFTSLSVAATSVSSVKVAPKVLQYEATPEVMLDPSKLSNNRGSKEATKFAKELKQLPISPISQTSGSTSSVRSCKNEDQKPLHHGAELIHKDDKTKDHTFLSNIRQAASVDNRLARCQRCNESGHSTQFCAVDKLHMSAMKPSLKRNSKDVDYRSSKWKDAVDVFTLESGTKRTARSPDQSMEVSMSSADVHSEATSKDFPSSLISSRNLAFMEHASVAQDFSNTANAIHVKQKVEDRKKYTFLPRKVTPLDFADDLNMQPVIQTLPDQVSMPLHLLRASVIPELDCIWEGVFEVLKIAKPPAFLDGIQAHLSSYVSPKALELVKKFPCKVQLEEVPRLSAWPFQSHENSPKEDNIALFFFAKDTESYEKYYLNLLEDMLKNDLALIGNIDAVELLILPSNLLPANSQCWNKLFYLWGVFRGRNISCLTDLPDLEKKPSVSSLNLEPTVQDQSIPDFSGLCSSYEIYDETSQELSRFDKFPKAKAIISSSCSNIQDVPTSGNEDRILNIKQIPPVQNLHLAVCGDKVLTEQTSCSCSASCPYTNVSQLPNVPVAYPEPKLQIDIEQLPLEMENDLTDLGKLAGDSDSSKDSEHHANASSTSISNCEEPVFSVLFNCQQGNARNVQKIKQKEKFITSEGVPDDQVSDAIKLDDLSWESRHNKKRPLPSSAETIIKPTADRMLWKDEASCTSMNDTELKKMRLDNGGHAACSSREETLSSGLPSKIHPLPSGCLNDGIGCDTMSESSKNAERFFLIDLGTATSTKADNLIYVLSSDDEDSPESMAPDLELALWGKKRPPKTDSSPWLSPNVGIKRNPDKPLAPAVDDGDDMLASLSLSLAFPATEKPRSAKPMTQDEQLLPDKPCINTSLLLFGGYTDT